MDSLSKIIEEKIKEAMENGEFNNLPGKGKPLDLSEYFKAPPHLRMGYSLLKNANVVPAEIMLMSSAWCGAKTLSNPNG